jgi:hypothetical protein
MDLWTGEILAKVLYTIFKGRPGCAYAIFASILLVIIGALFLTAQNPNDFVFPVILFVFVFIVVLSHAVRAIRQKSVQEIQAIDVKPVNEEVPLDWEISFAREPSPLQTEAHVGNVSPPGREITPIQEPALRQATRRERKISMFPNMQARDFLKVLIISVICFSLGYLLAFFIGERSLTLDLRDDELLQAIADPVIQLICGLPQAFCLFSPVGAIILILLIRFTGAKLNIILIISAILSFIFGVVLFIPVQLLLMLAYAI